MHFGGKKTFILVFQVSRERSENNEFDEAMQILNAAMNLRVPVEEEKDKDVFDVNLLIIY